MMGKNLEVACFLPRRATAPLSLISAGIAIIFVAPFAVLGVLRVTALKNLRKRTVR